MRETWRWFGQYDGIELSEISQTGAAGIVSSLHHIPYGEVWPRDEIARHRQKIESAGFTWDVVESLPIHEDIKRGAGNLSRYFSSYRQSLANLAAEGIRTVCYNFMPILDWTRTDLDAPAPRGGTCLRFSAAKMAAFEIHMLGREEAKDSYSPAAVAEGDKWFAQASKQDRDALLEALMSGLPGSIARYDMAELQAALATYHGLAHDDLRANLRRFLEEVIPTAAEHGMQLAIHPDDPPRGILGLPRIVSTAEDLEWILSTHPHSANGLTLCSGSLGSHPQNDVPAIASRFADRIHFAHLRNVRKFPDGSFEESAHLDGDVDLVALLKVLMATQRQREIALPFRADHGHALLSDLGREFQPGYTLIGRLRGLAELRGLITALGHQD